MSSSANRSPTSGDRSVIDTAGTTARINSCVSPAVARKPNSRYAKIEQCRHELALADKLFRRENIPVENSTHTSIEEIASKILARLGIERHMF